ncbi:uncharacterized protein An12g04980 [Aspergillus niger]|uniref:Contig An12c0160, genomic contig n=2 Tax=Aspergillus niger TaxID=5061 RepID=A2QZI0_ASPNC|nr:uncharacterized protein An12g04980 [Aspergillus niger]CAK46212.1 unnamed protein product [Aspergillus niger]
MQPLVCNHSWCLHRSSERMWGPCHAKLRYFG